MVTCYVMLHGMVMLSLTCEYVYACMNVCTRVLHLVMVNPNLVLYMYIYKYVLRA